MATYDALKAPPTALDKGGTEVLRAAIVEGGLHVSLRRAFDDPEAWGMVIADLTRHVARIYRTEENIPEERTIERKSACEEPCVVLRRGVPKCSLCKS